MKVNMKKVLIAVLGAVAIGAVDWVRFDDNFPAAEKGL